MNPETFVNENASLFTRIRRELHQIPEKGNQEYKTGGQIRHYLEEWEIPYTDPIAETGIMAWVEGRENRSDTPGTVIALRADMDGLPLHEPLGLPFASIRSGYMHACGHDAHMAIALGCALYFKQIQDELPGCVKFFFQPAEETIGGAKRMIEEGCMDRPKVDYVCGLHVAPSVPAGDIEIKYGQMYAASDEVLIRLNGKNSHGAYPEQGIDAIAMAASLVTALQTLVSRNVSPLDQAVLSFGQIRGGCAHNIIADQVVLKGALRTTSPKTRRLAKEIIIRQARHISAAFGGNAECEIIPGYDALCNTDEAVDLLLSLSASILGTEHIHKKTTPGMGVEDFSFFLNEAPGVFFHLGCGDESGNNAPLHSPAFLLNESCLSIGVRLMITLVQKLINRSLGLDLG